MSLNFSSLIVSVALVLPLVAIAGKKKAPDQTPQVIQTPSRFQCEGSIDDRSLYQSYSERPDILSLDPIPLQILVKSMRIPDDQIQMVPPGQLEELEKLGLFDPATQTYHSKNIPAWKSDFASAHKTKLGLVEALAEILELYPEHKIVVMGRDGEILYDAARVLTENSADQARVQLLLTSRRVLSDQNFKKYLEQSGLTDKALKNGEKFLLIDVGYAGSASEAIQNLYPAFIHQIQSHFLASVNPSIPSTRVFLERIGRNSEEITRFHLVTDLEGLPMFTNSGEEIRFADGQWQVLCSKVESDSGTEVNPDLAIERMSDIRQTLSQSEPKTLFEERRKTFRKLFKLWKLDENVELQNEMHALIQNEPVLGQALVSDFIEVMNKQYSSSLTLEMKE
jgi:hypothetical protein